MDTAPAAAPLNARVDEILSSGLADTYRQLPPAVQEKFKQLGEQTVAQIVHQLQGHHPSLEPLISLVGTWLRLIPNLNPYYLEQAAKIKTEQIISLIRPVTP